VSKLLNKTTMAAATGRTELDRLPPALEARAKTSHSYGVR
jgi:hypothetical protein